MNDDQLDNDPEVVVDYDVLMDEQDATIQLLLEMGEL